MIKIYGKTKFYGNISTTQSETSEIKSIYSSLIDPFVSEDNSISNEDSLILWSTINNIFFEL